MLFSTSTAGLSGHEGEKSNGSITTVGILPTLNIEGVGCIH